MSRIEQSGRMSLRRPKPPIKGGYGPEEEKVEEEEEEEEEEYSCEISTSPNEDIPRLLLKDVISLF